MGLSIKTPTRLAINNTRKSNKKKTPPIFFCRKISLEFSFYVKDQEKIFLFKRFPLRLKISLREKHEKQKNSLESEQLIINKALINLMRFSKLSQRWEKIYVWKFSLTFLLFYHGSLGSSTSLHLDVMVNKIERCKFARKVFDPTCCFHFD